MHVYKNGDTFVEAVGGEYLFIDPIHIIDNDEFEAEIKATKGFSKRCWIPLENSQAIVFNVGGVLHDIIAGDGGPVMITAESGYVAFILLSELDDEVLADLVDNGLGVTIQIDDGELVKASNFAISIGMKDLPIVQPNSAFHDTAEEEDDFADDDEEGISRDQFDMRELDGDLGW